jgi:hypothetical protein
VKSSSLPLPAVGEVIRYNYLWSHEYASGREEGTKDRPAAVVAVLQQADGQHEVVVLPITSSRPIEPATAVLLPTATRARLGLQAEPCWVVVSEYNRFVWPGPDLRPVDRGAGDLDVSYGLLPDRLMAEVREALRRWRAERAVHAVRRTE